MRYIRLIFTSNGLYIILDPNGMINLKKMQVARVRGNSKAGDSRKRTNIPKREIRQCSLQECLITGVFRYFINVIMQIKVSNVPDADRKMETGNRSSILGSTQLLRSSEGMYHLDLLLSRKWTQSLQKDLVFTYS